MVRSVVQSSQWAVRYEWSFPQNTFSYSNHEHSVLSTELLIPRLQTATPFIVFKIRQISSASSRSSLRIRFLYQFHCFCAITAVSTMPILPYNVIRRYRGDQGMYPIPHAVPINLTVAQKKAFTGSLLAVRTLELEELVARKEPSLPFRRPTAER